MNRRDVIKYGAVAPLTVGAGVVPLTVGATHLDYEQKYWEAQRHIDELEELVRHYDVNRELANHYEALDLNKKFAK